MGVDAGVQAEERSVSSLPSWTLMGHQTTRPRHPNGGASLALPLTLPPCPSRRSLSLEMCKKICWVRLGATHHALDACLPRLDRVHHQMLH